MESKKNYIVRLEDGRETEPMDKYTLIALARTGQLTPDCMVRSTILPTWEKAFKVEFLREFLVEQVQEAIQEERRNQSQWSRMREQMSLRGDDDPFAQIAQEGMTLEPGGPFMRLFAALLDVVIVAAGALAILGGLGMMLQAGIIGSGTIAYFWVILAWTWMLLYYIAGWSWRSQTIGQRFFGLVLIKKDRTGLYPGRAAAFLILLIALGPLSFISFALTGGRGTFQEAFTGTWVRRLVKTRGIV